MRKIKTPFIASYIVLFFAVVTIGMIVITNIPGVQIPILSKSTNDNGSYPTGDSKDGLSTASTVSGLNNTLVLFVLAAVTVLIPVVVALIVLMNDARYSELDRKWSVLNESIKSDTSSLLSGMKRDVGLTCLPMASYIVELSIKLLLFSKNNLSSDSRSYLKRSVQEGVKLLVCYSDKYKDKETAVRKLSRVVYPETLDCLNNIEEEVKKLPAERQRDDLLSVIDETRYLVRDGLKNKKL